jgi:serine/threonine protein kinase
MDGLQQLGTYSLVRRIASGGMAEVWMGRRLAMGGAAKTLAIKLLAAHLAENPVYRRMFVDEARLSMMLNHSNLVQVFDVGEQGGRSYLVMEWVDGLDLSRLIAALREAGERLDVGVVAHVVAEVLRGLAYAHELNGDRGAIVHRDISPHNVLLSVSGEVKISDFGVARLSSEETSGLHVRGKLRYMPPEQVRGESKHPTIDLYAVGALMQEMLDGVRFRAGLERDELFAKVLSGEAPPLQREDVPAELLELRERLLAPDRNARIGSASEALALLKRWPGLRNASDELAALVRRFVGVAAPRSGLGVEPSDESLQFKEGSDEPTALEGMAKPGSSEVATRTVPQSDSDTTPSALQRPAAMRPSTPARSRVRALGMMMVALVGLLLGIGLGGTYLSESSAAPPRANSQPSSHPNGPTHTHEDAPFELDTTPTALLAPTTTPETAPEATPTPQPAASEPLPRSRARDAVAAKPKAKVEFAAHQFFFVWVKVGSRTLALEPTATLELPPGRHTVQLRERPSDPWLDAGRIRVEAGQRYRVKLRKPAGLTLEPL